MKILIIVNAVCVVALMAITMWAGFALGNHEEFESRVPFVLIAQAICIVLMVFRKLLKEEK